MTTVIRPRGPLPRRVYWVRRLSLLVAVVLLAAFVWWLLPCGGSPRAAGQTGTGQQIGAGAGGSGGTDGRAPMHPTTTTTTTPTQPTNTHSTGGPTHTTTPPKHSSTPHSTPPSTVGQPLAACNAPTLHLALHTVPMKSGASTTVGVELWTGNGTSCSLALSPRLLEARIQSGGVTVWLSSTCPDNLPARNVVVGPTQAQVYAFHWDGRDNDSGCTPNGKIAQPGGYWAEAALIGGTPAKVYLQVN